MLVLGSILYVSTSYCGVFLVQKKAQRIIEFQICTKIFVSYSLFKLKFTFLLNLYTVQTNNSLVTCSLRTENGSKEQKMGQNYILLPFVSMKFYLKLKTNQIMRRLYHVEFHNNCELPYSKFENELFELISGLNSQNDFGH